MRDLWSHRSPIVSLGWMDRWECCHLTIVTVYLKEAIDRVIEEARSSNKELQPKIRRVRCSKFAFQTPAEDEFEFKHILLRTTCRTKTNPIDGLYNQVTNDWRKNRQKTEHKGNQQPFKHQPEIGRKQQPLCQSKYQQTWHQAMNGRPPSRI